METLFRDLRIGVRVLWKQKTLSLAAIATLGICIAATTAIFCIVNAIVRPILNARRKKRYGSVREISH